MKTYKVTIYVENDTEQEIAREFRVTRDMLYVKDWSDEIISTANNLEEEF